MTMLSSEPEVFPPGAAISRLNCCRCPTSVVEYNECALFLLFIDLHVSVPVLTGSYLQMQLVEVIVNVIHYSNSHVYICSFRFTNC